MKKILITTMLILTTILSFGQSYKYTRKEENLCIYPKDGMGVQKEMFFRLRDYDKISDYMIRNNLTFNTDLVKALYDCVSDAMSSVDAIYTFIPSTYYASIDFNESSKCIVIFFVYDYYDIYHDISKLKKQTLWGDDTKQKEIDRLLELSKNKLEIKEIKEHPNKSEYYNERLDLKNGKLVIHKR